MSNYKVIGRSRQYVCFKQGPFIFNKLPKRNMTTPGLQAKCLYKCYQRINLKPGRQNFMNETSLRQPALAAISYDNETYEKPVQKGEGVKKTEPTTNVEVTPPSKDSKLTIENILKKFEHPLFATKTEQGQKNSLSENDQSTQIKSEPKAKKPKKQSGGNNEVFKFY